MKITRYLFASFLLLYSTFGAEASLWPFRHKKDDGIHTKTNGDVTVPTPTAKPGHGRGWIYCISSGRPRDCQWATWHISGESSNMWYSINAPSVRKNPGDYEVTFNPGSARCHLRPLRVPVRVYRGVTSLVVVSFGEGKNVIRARYSR